MAEEGIDRMIFPQVPYYGAPLSYTEMVVVVWAVIAFVVFGCRAARGIFEDGTDPVERRHMVLMSLLAPLWPLEFAYRFAKVLFCKPKEKTDA
jgi:hypothetical protein